MLRRDWAWITNNGAAESTSQLPPIPISNRIKPPAIAAGHRIAGLVTRKPANEGVKFRFDLSKRALKLIKPARCKLLPEPIMAYADRWSKIALTPSEAFGVETNARPVDLRKNVGHIIERKLGMRKTGPLHHAGMQLRRGQAPLEASQNPGE